MDVRIKSILTRYAEEKGAAAAQAAVIRPAESDSEKKLQMVLAKFGEAVESAWNEIAPHKICAYMSEVSDAFSAFYLDNNILGETDENRQKGFIALIRLTSRVLETCMDLIGVKAPDHM